MTIILPKNTAVATLCNSTLKLPIDMYSRLPNKRVLLDSFDCLLVWFGRHHKGIQAAIFGMYLNVLSILERGSTRMLFGLVFKDQESLGFTNISNSLTNSILTMFQEQTEITTGQAIVPGLALVW